MLINKKISLKIFFLFTLIIILSSRVYALSYGKEIYGENCYGENCPTIPSLYCGDGACNNGESCSTCPGDCGGCSSGSSSSSTASKNKTPQCFSDLDCKQDEYCFNGSCIKAECFNNSVCNEKEGEICWNHNCVKLFDMEILEFESPVKLGEFFNFTYFVKAVAEINGDVEIDFWIEKEGNKVASGKDTIYITGFEEKTKIKRLFLPSDISPGSYMFYISVTYEDYTAKAYRNIEININNEGIARIKLIQKEESIVIYVIGGLIGISVFLLCLVFYLERKKIRRWYLYEQKWIKKHKAFVILIVLLAIIGFLIYYFRLYGFFTKTVIEIIKRDLGIWIGGIALIIIFVFLIIFLRKKHKKRKFRIRRKNSEEVKKSISYSRY